MPPNWRLLTVDITATLIFPSNKDRIELAIQNLSTAVIFWDHHPTVDLGIGGLLLPYQTVILTETDGDLTHEPIWGIADSPGCHIVIYEVTGQIASWKKLLELR
jgi:hypothetical protein